MRNTRSGKKINFSPVFNPPLPEQPQETVAWTLSGTYINAFTVWIFGGGIPILDVNQPDEGDYDSAYGLTDFRIESSRLKWINTFAWWQTGSTSGYESENIDLQINLVFANGQTISLTRDGLIGMYQPTTSWKSSGYAAGVPGGEIIDGLVDVGLFDNAPASPIVITADSYSIFPGTFGITQLVKRDSTTATWADWELDGYMPYDNGDHSAFNPYVSNIAEARLIDQPSVPAVGEVYCNDQFQDYLMFRG